MAVPAPVRTKRTIGYPASGIVLLIVAVIGLHPQHPSGTFKLRSTPLSESGIGRTGKPRSALNSRSPMLKINGGETV